MDHMIVIKVLGLVHAYQDSYFTEIEQLDVSRNLDNFTGAIACSLYINLPYICTDVLVGHNKLVSVIYNQLQSMPKVILRAIEKKLAI